MISPSWDIFEEPLVYVPFGGIFLCLPAGTAKVAFTIASQSPAPSESPRTIRGHKWAFMSSKLKACQREVLVLNQTWNSNAFTPSTLQLHGKHNVKKKKKKLLTYYGIKG